MKAIEREPSCPLCGAPNGCAMAANKAVVECWCVRAKLDPAALARVPAEKVNLACVCAKCGAGK